MVCTYDFSKDDRGPEEWDDGEGAVDDRPVLELNQGSLVVPDQSFNQLINQSVNQSISQPFRQLIINRSVS